MSAQPTKGHRGLGRVNPSTEDIIGVILQKSRLDVETESTQGGQVSLLLSILNVIFHHVKNCSISVLFRC